MANDENLGQQKMYKKKLSQMLSCSLVRGQNDSDNVVRTPLVKLIKLILLNHSHFCLRIQYAPSVDHQTTKSWWVNKNR